MGSFGELCHKGEQRNGAGAQEGHGRMLWVSAGGNEPAGRRRIMQEEEGTAARIESRS